jgi:integrase/recombinase XerD
MISCSTASGAVGEWEQWMRAAGRSPRTITDRVQFIARFESATGADSHTVSWHVIADYLANEAYSAGTRQTYYAHLRAWFGWLARMDYRLDDPTIKLAAPRRPKRKPRPVTLEQLTRILATRMHHRTRAMVLLGAYEGLRVSEIARVRGTDLRAGSLRVLGKGDRVDDLPIHDLVAEIAATLPRTGWWFPSQVGLGPIRSKSVSAILSDLMGRAGVPATPHALRHFFGTETLRATGNLELTRQLMRHESVATTSMYTEVDDTARRAAIAALPRPLVVAA